MIVVSWGYLIMVIAVTECEQRDWVRCAMALCRVLKLSAVIDERGVVDALFTWGFGIEYAKRPLSRLAFDHRINFGPHTCSSSHY